VCCLSWQGKSFHPSPPTGQSQRGIYIRACMKSQAAVLYLFWRWRKDRGGGPYVSTHCIRKADITPPFPPSAFPFASSAWTSLKPSLRMTAHCHVGVSLTSARRWRSERVGGRHAGTGGRGRGCPHERPFPPLPLLPPAAAAPAQAQDLLQRAPRVKTLPAGGGGQQRCAILPAHHPC